MMGRALLAAGLGALISACSVVGPDYVKPTAPVPTAYRPGWKEARPADGIPRGAWWSIFTDPQLDTLASRIEVSNQTLRIAEARFRQAQAVTAQARAGWYPSVGADASASRSGVRSSFSTGATTTYHLGTDALWEPDLWGKVRRTVEAATATEQASVAEVESARLSAEAALAQNYFLLRVIDAQRELLVNTVEAFQRSLDLTHNRYESGVAAKVDVVQADVQLKGAQAQLIDVGIDRARFEHAIALLVGEPASSLSIPPAPLIAKHISFPLGLPSELLERRPDIAAQERSIAAANARIGVAQAAFYPSLSLSGSLGFRNSLLGDLISVPSRVWALGAGLAQTLFDGGARKAVSQQAIAAYDSEVALYRQTVLAAFREVEDQLATLRILEEEAKVQDELVRAARHATELVTNQYRAGVVSFLNVINAQTTALNAERTALNLEGRRLIAAVLLVKALGGGWTTNGQP
ncbi:MAG: efflux transporter outer membrane subunit [Betaproteobacteria bacterium]|nr:efflux transporter outer membrane subunit [Betaproteobacteria bacterium]